MGNAGWRSLKQKYDLQYDPGTHGFTRVWVDKGTMVFASLVKKDDRITRKKRMILLRSRFLDTTILLGALGGCQNGASGSARRRLFADSLPLERNPKRGTALLAQTRGVAWPRPTFPALVQQGKHKHSAGQTRHLASSGKCRASSPKRSRFRPASRLSWMDRSSLKPPDGSSRHSLQSRNSRHEDSCHSQRSPSQKIPSHTEQH